METLIGQLIGPDGIVVVVAIAIVLIFGGTKLPSLARGLGSASHEFRRGLHGEQPDAVEPEE